MYTPNQSTKICMKEDLIACSNCSASQKFPNFFSSIVSKKGKNWRHSTLLSTFPPPKSHVILEKFLLQSSPTPRSHQIQKNSATTKFSLSNNEGVYDQLTIFPFYTCSIQSLYSNPSLAVQALTLFPKLIPIEETHFRWYS